MTLDDIDLFEINEAFASQAVYCVKKLGLSMVACNLASDDFFMETTNEPQ